MLQKNKNKQTIFSKMESKDKRKKKEVDNHEEDARDKVWSRRWRREEIKNWEEEKEQEDKE